MWRRVLRLLGLAPVSDLHQAQDCIETILRAMGQMKHPQGNENPGTMTMPIQVRADIVHHAAWEVLNQDIMCEMYARRSRKGTW